MTQIDFNMRVPVIPRGQAAPVGRGVPVRPGAAQADPVDLSAFIPPITVERCWFNELSTGAGLTPATGEAAWYGLKRIEVNAGGESFGLVRIDGTVSAADITGAAVSPSGGTVQAWGSADGSGMNAAIIIGRNLPMVVGQWRSARVFAPGFGSQAFHLVNPVNPPEYLKVIQIPPGDFLADVPPKLYLPTVFPMGAAWFNVGDSLDVAVVVGQNLTASRVLVGNAMIELFVQPRYSGRRWGA